MQYTDEELIDSMIAFYMANGRWPKLRDMAHPYPGKSTYARRFASAPDMQDGFGRALTMAQIKYSDEELNRALEDFKAEVKSAVVKDLNSIHIPGLAWVNRRIMKFKEWIK